jgi:hypothetical protein
VVALFSVAVPRPPRTSAAVYGLSVLASLLYVMVRPEPGVPNNRVQIALLAHDAGLLDDPE